MFPLRVCKLLFNINLCSRAPSFRNAIEDARERKCARRWPCIAVAVHVRVNHSPDSIPFGKNNATKKKSTVVMNISHRRKILIPSDTLNAYHYILRVSRLRNIFSFDFCFLFSSSFGCRNPVKKVKTFKHPLRN